MAMNELATVSSALSDLRSKLMLKEGLSHDDKDMEELKEAMEVLAEVDMTLAYSSEKLVNFENLLLHLLGWKNDIGAINVEDDDISAESIGNSLTFSLLYAFLSSEVRELDNLMSELQDLVYNARLKISSFGHLGELLTGLEDKLNDSSDSIRQSQESILEIKIQLAKLQITSLPVNQSEWKTDLGLGGIEEFQLGRTECKPQMQTAEQRGILRMLEKSLSRELELEKKLTELKQNEEDLKLKLRLTEQVVVNMEEAAEGVWGRFLEADNMVEVLMGISKEMASRLQMVLFSLNGSIKREEELKQNLQNCLEKLNEKDVAIGKLNSSIAHLITDNAEVTNLRERVKILEARLKEAESQLREANASNKASQEKLKDMGSENESLRENIYDAETRAESAEAKNTQLTETNLELTEELGFLKASNENNAKKVSLLEKQLRDLDIQLQHARASSEASQEQQNLLYSAIWDMETLIDELKQKVAKAESKTEHAEERGVLLSKTNSELNKEVEYMRERMEFLETSLNQSSIEKVATAKDVDIKTNLIMNTVMQLAAERERIKKQLYSFTRENKLLKEKLRKTKIRESVILHSNVSGDNKVLPASMTNLADITQASVETARGFSPEIQEEESEAAKSQNEMTTSVSSENSSNLVEKPDEESLVETNRSCRGFTFMAILVVLFSILMAYFLKKSLAVFKLVDN